MIYWSITAAKNTALKIMSMYLQKAKKFYGFPKNMEQKIF